MRRLQGKKDSSLLEELGFKKRNLIWFLSGLVVIVIGYFLLATGGKTGFQSLTLAPILLVIAYIIIIPIAIMISNNKQKNQG
jgi:uncharacterized membrane protein YphA (DoxX/SURF4 family)